MKLKINVKSAQFIHRYHHILLVILLLVILFLLPFSCPLFLHRKVPNLADFLAEYQNKGVSFTEILGGVFRGFIYFVTGMVWVVLLIAGVSLVFDVTWRGRLIWVGKSPYKTYMGYYLILEFMFPIFVQELLKWWNPALWGSAQASLLLLVLTLFSLSLFTARVISKLPIEVGGTNLGSFIITIYLSYGIFKILSEGFNFIAFWRSILDVDFIPSYLNAFFILSLPAIFSLVLLVLDTLVIPKVERKKNSSKKS